MAAAHVLGACVCPWCKSARASVRLSASGLAYVTCQGCQMQTFSRSEKSDELIRNATTAAPAAPAKPAEPAVRAAPTPARPAAPPVDQIKPPAPAPAPWSFGKW